MPMRQDGDARAFVADRSNRNNAFDELAGAFKALQIAKQALEADRLQDEQTSQAEAQTRAAVKSTFTDDTALDERAALADLMKSYEAATSAVTREFADDNDRRRRALDASRNKTAQVRAVYKQNTERAIAYVRALQNEIESFDVDFQEAIQKGYSMEEIQAILQDVHDSLDEITNYKLQMRNETIDHHMFDPEVELIYKGCFGILSTMTSDAIANTKTLVLSPPSQSPPATTDYAVLSAATGEPGEPTIQKKPTRIYTRLGKVAPVATITLQGSAEFKKAVLEQNGSVANMAALIIRRTREYPESPTSMRQPNEIYTFKQVGANDIPTTGISSLIIRRYERAAAMSISLDNYRQLLGEFMSAVYAIQDGNFWMCVINAIYETNRVTTKDRITGTLTGNSYLDMATLLIQAALTSS